VGVTSAADRHPHFWKMNLPNIIITRVTRPVAEEKLPIKAEYSLGLGNAACSGNIGNRNRTAREHQELDHVRLHSVTPEP
jgi:hypothetical protein